MCEYRAQYLPKAVMLLGCLGKQWKSGVNSESHKHLLFCRVPNPVRHARLRHACQIKEHQEACSQQVSSVSLLFSTEAPPLQNKLGFCLEVHLLLHITVISHYSQLLVKYEKYKHIYITVYHMGFLTFKFTFPNSTVLAVA